MEKPKILYHGTRKEIVGDFLEPRRAGGLGSEKSKLNGVYATDNRLAAIVMGIISGAKLSSMNFEKGTVEGIIYDGEIKRKEVYLYSLPAEGFVKLDSWQWICCGEVKPICVEKLDVNDYMYLIRKATPEEKSAWMEKHKNELRKID